MQIEELPLLKPPHALFFRFPQGISEEDRTFFEQHFAKWKISEGPHLRLDAPDLLGFIYSDGPNNENIPAVADNAAKEHCRPTEELEAFLRRRAEGMEDKAAFLKENAEALAAEYRNIGRLQIGFCRHYYSEPHLRMEIQPRLWLKPSYNEALDAYLSEHQEELLAYVLEKLNIQRDSSAQFEIACHLGRASDIRPLEDGTQVYPVQIRLAERYRAGQQDFKLRPLKDQLEQHLNAAVAMLALRMYMDEDALIKPFGQLIRPEVTYSGGTVMVDPTDLMKNNEVTTIFQRMILDFERMELVCPEAAMPMDKPATLLCQEIEPSAMNTHPILAHQRMAGDTKREIISLIPTLFTPKPEQKQEESSSAPQTSLGKMLAKLQPLINLAERFAADESSGPGSKR